MSAESIYCYQHRLYHKPGSCPLCVVPLSSSTNISLDDVKAAMAEGDYRKGFCTGLYIGDPKNLSDKQLLDFGRDLISELYFTAQLLGRSTPKSGRSPRKSLKSLMVGLWRGRSMVGW